MHFPHVWIVGTIHRSQRPVSSDAALEFFRHLLDRALFKRIGAPAGRKAALARRKAAMKAFKREDYLEK